MPVSAHKRIALAIGLLCLSQGAPGGAQDTPAADTAAHRLEKAREHRQGGELDLAAQELEQLLLTLPTGAEARTLRAAAHRELGEIQLARKNPGEALRSFEAALELDPSQPVVHYQAGLLERQLGQNQKAVFHLKQAVQQGFRNAGALLNLASAQFAAGQATEALETSREMLAMDLSSADLPLRLGRLLFEHLFYKDALKAFEAAREKAPESYEVRFYLALTNYLLNRFEEAIDLLLPLSEARGTAEVSNLLASARAQVGQLEEAMGLLRQAIKKDPGSPHAYLNLALVLLEQGRVEEAETLFEKLRLGGTDQGPKVFYSVRQNSCPQVDEEIRGGHGIAQPDPERAEFFFHLAGTFQQRYHHATAVELLRVARRYEGDTARVLYALGFSCLNLDSASQTALAMLQKAIEREPGRAEAYAMLGQAYVKQRKPGPAVDAFRRAVKLEPGSARYQTELGRALLTRGPGETGAEEEAIKAFEEAITLEPSNALAHYELGKVLARQGRPDEALAHLNKAVEAEPEFYEAFYLLGRLHTRLKHPQQAERSFETFRRKKETAAERSTLTAGYVTAER